MTSPRLPIAALLLAAVAALGLTACSGSSDAVQPLAAAVTTTAPTPSPTPTMLTKQQAGAAYLAAVTPSNKALNKVEKTLKTRNLAKIRAAAKSAAKANRAFLVVLTDTQWPKNVQKNVDKLSADVASDQTALTEVGKSTNMKDANGYWSNLSSDNSQAQLIRVKLGLKAAG